MVKFTEESPEVQDCLSKELGYRNGWITKEKLMNIVVS